jgi:hypothetical protein
MNVYKSSDYTNRETGEVTLGKVKLQLLTTTALRNGEMRNELFDISIPEHKLSLYEDKVGEDVEVDVALIGKASFYGI